MQVRKAFSGSRLTDQAILSRTATWIARAIQSFCSFSKIARFGESVLVKESQSFFPMVPLVVVKRITNWIDR
jgi:hypothetical protein